MKEHQHIEWKESWRDEYLKWICGFANADGGVLVIGRNDTGKVVGVDRAHRLLEEIPNKVRDVLGIMVDVNLKNEADLEYIEIRVEPYPYPVSYRGEYHYRSGSTKQVLKGASLDRFLLGKQGRRWDGVPLPGFGLRDCSPKAFQIFRSRAARSGRISEDVANDDDAALMENLQLTEGTGLKRGAALLFGQDPERFFTGAFIKIGFFRSDDDLRFQDEIHGSLFEQVDGTLELLKVKYLKAYIRYEGIQRIEEFLFPEPALREAVLNAIVHRDYGGGVPIQISVYDDRFVIWNYGQLPENWTLDRLQTKHPSNPFNPLVANAFFRAGYIEAWGRGIEKINRECREHNIPPPVFDFSMSGLMVTLRANPDTAARLRQDVSVGEERGAGLGERLGERLGETRNAILHLMHEDPAISMAALAEKLGLSTTAIENNVQYLKTNGFVRRTGPARGGRWEVLK